MGILLDAYKKDRQRGKSHSEAEETCLYRMTGMIQARVGTDSLKRHFKSYSEKIDYKKIVLEIEALNKEWESLENYKNLDVSEIPIP